MLASQRKQGPRKEMGQSEVQPKFHMTKLTQLIVTWACQQAIRFDESTEHRTCYKSKQAVKTTEKKNLRIGVILLLENSLVRGY